MYPMIYFQSFPQLVMGNEVFVAMPMGDPSFNPIWIEVYQGAIRSSGLDPFRVDIPQTGDSILIDILRGLRRAKLVLADISPDHRGGAYPNPNVMYELGIAHAMRLPETVIVVRRSGTEIPFDIRHIRAQEYDARDLASARESIRSYVEGALALGRSLGDELVEQAWAILDPVSRDIVMLDWYRASGRAALDAKEKGEESYYDPHPGVIEYPRRHTSFARWHDEQLFPAYNRLIEVGILEAVTGRWDMVGTELPRAMYRFTVLGRAVAERFTSIS